MLIVLGVGNIKTTPVDGFLLEMVQRNQTVVNDGGSIGEIGDLKDPFFNIYTKKKDRVKAIPRMFGLHRYIALVPRALRKTLFLKGWDRY